MRMTQGWEAKAGTEAEAGPGSGGQVLDPTLPGPGLVSSLGRQRRRTQGEARGEHGARRHAARKQRPPPPRAGRDLSGQRGAERPDAGGGRRRPRAAGFSRSAASAPSRVPARARPPAEGAGDAAVGGGGATGTGGLKEAARSPGGPVPAEKAAWRAAPTAAGGGGEERHPPSAAGRSAQPI